MATSTGDALRQATMQLERALSQRDSGARKSGQGILDVPAPFVDALFRCAIELSQSAGIPKELAALIAASTLQAGFPAFLLGMQGRPREAAAVLTAIWAERARLFGGSVALDEGPQPAVVSAGGAKESAGLLRYHEAVAEQLQHATIAAEGQALLRRLIAILDLSRDEAGRIFGVSGETLRRWETGATTIPAKRLAAITSAYAGLTRLLALFRPERLAIAIRRPAELFDGEAALDWILRGRIQDTADRYDRALRYQG